MEAVSIVVGLTLIGRLVHTTLRKAKIRSLESSLVVKLCTTSTNCTEQFLKAVGGTRFLQAVRDIDTTRGARAILQYYKRCKSDSLKLKEIRE